MAKRKTKGGEIASAIFSPNSKKGKISTSFGDKTKEGLTAMIENDSYSAKEIANAIFEFNEKRDKVKTNYGNKTKEGLIAMIESARESYAKGGETEEYTWTDKEMQELLEDIGYEIDDDDLSELAINEGFYWDSDNNVWKRDMIEIFPLDKNGDNFKI
jgi:hypothetical protein